MRCFYSSIGMKLESMDLPSLSNFDFVVLYFILVLCHHDAECQVTSASTELTTVAPDDETTVTTTPTTTVVIDLTPTITMMSEDPLSTVTYDFNFTSENITTDSTGKILFFKTLVNCFDMQ